MVNSVEQEQDRLHIAAFPWLGSGHVNPMVELSRRLVPLGFTITIILSQRNYQIFRPKLGQQEHIHLVYLPDPLKSDGSLAAPPEIRESLRSRLGELHPPVKCLISDWFQGWSQDIANQLGLPRVGLVTGGAAAEAIFSRLSSLVSDGHVPVNANPGVDTLITYIPGMDPFPKAQLPLGLHEAGPAMNTIKDQVMRLKESLCVLVNTVEEFERDVVRARNEEVPYLPIGPLLAREFLVDEDGVASELSDKDREILRWLDKHEPDSVLYVAFGSEISLPADQIEKLGKALRGSGHLFLWSLRQSFVKDGPPGFYEEFVGGFDHPKGCIVEWAPQLHVLRHKAVGAFFTHSGYNSTIEGICCGVPQLCWPCDAEQNLNALWVEQKWKVGVSVAEGQTPAVRAEEIQELIVSVMEGALGKEMRTRIQEYKDIARAAVRETGSSYNNLLEFRRILVSTAKRCN